MKHKETKRCPRCNKKMLASMPKCETCGLIFSRLSFASNNAGKKALKNHQENKVVYVKTPPKDVNKWKLFFLSLFLGFSGIQYYKVGRTKWFAFMLFAFVSFMLFATLEYTNVLNVVTNQYLALLLYFKYFPGSLGVLMWFGSTFQIAFNLFKYPVSIDENFATEDLDKNVANSILKEVHNQRKTSQKSKTQK